MTSGYGSPKVGEAAWSRQPRGRPAGRAGNRRWRTDSSFTIERSEKGPSTDETSQVKIEEIRSAVQAGRWAMTRHAREKAGKRQITGDALVHALARGEILEDYGDDPRGPSALILGHTSEDRPLHAVCAFDPGGTLVIVTVYEPQLPGWRDERTRADKDGESNGDTLLLLRR